MLYPTGDVEALAEALIRFAALPDARVGAMGAAARAWVERDFNAAVYLERQLDLYGSLSTQSDKSSLRTCLPLSSASVAFRCRR